MAAQATQRSSCVTRKVQLRMKEMEAIFDELTDENGDFQFSLQWDTVLAMRGLSGKWERDVDPAKESFWKDGYRISWYHSKNQNYVKYPVVIITWTSNHKEDDWDEHEQEVDATAEDIAAFIRNLEGGYEGDSGLPDRLEEIG